EPGRRLPPGRRRVLRPRAADRARCRKRADGGRCGVAGGGRGLPRRGLLRCGAAAGRGGRRHHRAAARGSADVRPQAAASRGEGASGGRRLARGDGRRRGARAGARRR
ncbi:MAG: hypothetical protein AVDCRST_MAG38-264, partial [uncultured Solirubrobacteraceae bacterium]